MRKSAMLIGIDKHHEVFNSPEMARGHQADWAARHGLAVAWTSKMGIEFCLVPPGRTWVGAVARDADAARDESPPALVELARPLYVSRAPLLRSAAKSFVSDGGGDRGTEALRRDRGFAADCRDGPPGLATDGIPATFISYMDAEVVCAWMAKIEARVIRLPLEAEWEYFSRAGATGRNQWGSSAGAVMVAPAVYSAPGPQPAELHRANAWGLIDVLGNVWEWTTSPYRALSDGALFQSSPARAGGSRVVRGGSWRDASAAALRFSRRKPLHVARRDDDVGVRLVCDLDS